MGPVHRSAYHKTWSFDYHGIFEHSYRYHYKWWCTATDQFCGCHRKIQTRGEPIIIRWPVQESQCITYQTKMCLLFQQNPWHRQESTTTLSNRTLPASSQSRNYAPYLHVRSWNGGSVLQQFSEKISNICRELSLSSDETRGYQQLLHIETVFLRPTNTRRNQDYCYGCST